MTHHTDILGRPPIMRAIPQRADEMQPCEDWRGASIIRNVPRHLGTNSFNFEAHKQKKANAKKAARRRPSSGVCGADGCNSPLSPNNKMRVCKDHAHSQACQCLPCGNKRARGLK